MTPLCILKCVLFRFQCFCWPTTTVSKKTISVIFALWYSDFIQIFCFQSLFGDSVYLSFHPRKCWHEEKKHFTRDELEQILGNNLEQQFFDKNGPERFWVTQIAAYSDARLNEVCQLNIIWYQARRWNLDDESTEWCRRQKFKDSI